jgi:hypothetical protein
LAGCWFHNNEKVEMAIHEWLHIQEPDFYSTGVLKFMPLWDTFVNVLRDYVEK